MAWKRTKKLRKSHEELLRQAMTQTKPFHLPPHSGVGPREEGKTPAGNMTDYLLMISPILVNQQVAGLVEVWQGANRPPQATTGYLQYMSFMAELAARYQRNQIMGELTGQQQVWTQLEAFASQVHNSLHPTEVAYVVANEGRRLIECDRVTVAVRYGSKARIEAVSGADVVERRSNLVRLMRHAVRAGAGMGRETALQRHPRRQLASQGVGRSGRLPGREQQQATHREPAQGRARQGQQTPAALRSADGVF